MAPVSEKTIGRLSLYRRLLEALLAQGVRHVYSHQLARLARGTAPQVRRDMMALGCAGSPIRGYDVAELARGIRAFLGAPVGQNVALVGVGNLGRAILAYFAGRRLELRIVAAFDVAPAKINRVIEGCPCHDIRELRSIARQRDIQVGVIAVPAAKAQAVADELMRAGVRGILNFAPVRLRVDPDVYLEEIDMTTALEKVAYFARQGAEMRSLRP